MLNILVISDEAKELYGLFKAEKASSEGQNASSSASALPAGRREYDIAFVDLDTENWRERLMEVRHRMPVVAFSRPDVRKAVEAMKLGAGDYLEKPLTADTLAEVMARHRHELLTHKYGFDEIIGASGPMQEIFGLIKRAAASESSVLITGESGTGKELLARAIHRWSPRSDRSFMTINCSAIPDTLLESELFGFEKGSFTGAQYTKKGLLELADGGTVFFDEIGDVSPLFQTKILRVLQEGEIMRIGGSRPMHVDVRFITATNKDLRAACQRGGFREDLYYRLNVINIHLPPLRERTADVALLAKHFVTKHASKRKDVLIKGISPEAMAVLTAYSFPGNVRELENIIERAISFADIAEIFPSDLPAFLRQEPTRPRAASPRLKDALADFEKQTIAAALIEAGGNISRAAASLGIYRQQLQRKIKEYRIAI
ncbi:MAG: hypothetical protein A2X56_05705 [Nitrospirae bacterium GWC2_57_13]|nr:MAG: hypothetical protein A2X56_05705 [Nitrospirae bacterium GWC2_57_13]HAS53762.1 hypothetical protein [Nitrospiraceae bacterium]